jgi:hypothetical protein
LGISAVTYVVVSLHFSEDLALWELVSMGDVLVGLLIVAIVAILYFVYCRPTAIRDAMSENRNATYHSLRHRRIT